MNKAKLPTKTRVAVWWIRIISIAIALSAFVFFICVASTDNVVKEFQGIYLFIVVSIVLPVWLLFLLPSIFLVFKKIWGWTTSIIMLSSEIMGVLGVCIYFAITEGLYYLQYTPATIFLLIPFTLLILDRKNYFEMVRQRELEKKGKE